MNDPGNRVALVTGAARGIGAATVAALAADGWRVVAVDRCADDPALPYPLGTRAELDRVVASACAAGGRDCAVAVQADTRDAGALTAAVAVAEDHWDGLDAAVAAAGVIAGGVPAWQVPPDQERAVLDIDLGGVLTLARVAVPALLRRPQPRHGRFLAVASAAATRGLPMLAAYCAAKAGVAGFIRALAAELSGTGITANAVSPGSTATPILDESARLYDLPDAAAFAAQQPLGRLTAAGRGGRGAGVPGRGRRQRHDRGRGPRRRRPGPVRRRRGAVRRPPGAHGGRQLLLELGVEGDVHAGERLADRAGRLRLRGDLGELPGGQALRLTAHGELDAGQPETARRVGSE